MDTEEKQIWNAHKKKYSKNSSNQGSGERDLPESVPEVVKYLRVYGLADDYYVRADDIADDLDISNTKAGNCLGKIDEAYSEVYEEGIDDELDDLKDKIGKNQVPPDKSLVFGRTDSNNYMTSVFRSERIYNQILEELGFEEEKIDLEE